MRKLFSAMMLACLVSTGVVDTFAQDRSTVTGVVTDQSGNPVAGALVTQSGTAGNGTVTGAAGEFSIAVPANASLTVNCLGYLEQTVPVNGQTNIRVALVGDAQIIEDIVITGYGTASSRDISGSIASLSTDELNQGPVTSLSQMLQGRAAGVAVAGDGNPNNPGAIVIRGTSTLRADGMSPLYVVDGVPVQSAFVVNGVTMQGASLPATQDIVSIDILKDASAAAIYGSRAANGVILITTRQGQKGERKYINFDSYVNIETVANRYEMMSADEYRAYLATSKIESTSKPSEGWDHGVDVDYQKEAMQTAVSHNHYLNMGGSSGGTKYDASVNFLSRQGLIKNSGMERFNARASIDQTAFNERLTIGMTLNGSVTNSNPLMMTSTAQQADLLKSMLTFVPTVNPTDANGVYMQDPSRRDDNPIAEINQITRDRRSENLFGSVRAKLNIIEGLDYNLMLSYQTARSTSGRYQSIDYMPEYTNNGAASRSTIQNDNLVFENYFSYAKRIDNHSLNAMIGYSWQEENTGNAFQVDSENFVSDATGYYNLAMGAPDWTSFRVNYGTTLFKTLRMISFYGRLNYSYDDRYILQASIRRDGSSAFGVNSRWGFFPSVSGAWRIIGEEFMANQSVFDDLKLKVGWGISGNSQGFDPMISRLRYGSSGKYFYNDAFLVGIAPVANENPDLRWEKTSMVNVGLDMAFFNNRLTFAVEYYNKLTGDLIWNYSVPTTEYLYGTMTANVGKIRNSGIEATITATPVQTGNFSWSTTMTLSHNKNKVITLSNDKFAVDNDIRRGPSGAGQSGGSSLIIREGQPLGTLFAFKFAGFSDDGKSQFYDKDGNKTTAPTDVTDYYMLGDTQPALTFGWNHNLTWKNWSLDLMFSGMLGRKILNGTLAQLTYTSRVIHYNMPRYVLDSGQPIDDPLSTFMSDRYVEKGDYLRLQNIALSYRFNLKPESGIKSLSVYGNINNAFVITGYRGIDPEVGIGGLDPGVDINNFYPMPRSFQIGVRFGF